jgi:hypothetical protein
MIYLGKTTIKMNDRRKSVVRSNRNGRTRVSVTSANRLRVAVGRLLRLTLLFGGAIIYSGACLRLSCN